MLKTELILPNKNRSIMMKQVCSRCILDSDYPGISFDDQGVCNYCKKYDAKDRRYKHGPQSDQKLNRLINTVRSEGKNKEYDCIQGVSGGRDSTYCLYLLKKWGLNPLAVHVDNYMDTQIASENIKKACKKLDVDLHTFAVDPDEFKDLQRSFLFASVPSIDIPTDHAFVTLLYSLAMEKNIKYVFSGASFRTEGPGSIEWSLHNDEKFILDIQNRFGTIPLKEFPIRTILDVLKWKCKGIREIRPLYYMDYHLGAVDRLLEQELGWKYYGGHHFESIFTRWSFAYLLPHKFGIDKRLTDYAVLVLSNQLSRDDAFERMNQRIYSSKQEEEDRRFIMNKLDLTTEEMDTIINAPPKKNFDYAHHPGWYRSLYYLVSPWRY